MWLPYDFPSKAIPLAKLYAILTQFPGEYLLIANPTTRELNILDTDHVLIGTICLGAEIFEDYRHLDTPQEEATHE